METLFSGLMTLEQERRVLVEAPPNGEHMIITTPNTGIKQRIRKGGRKWDNNNPCVNCDMDECLIQIADLRGTTREGIQTSICKNPLNDMLITMLCNWRRHVKETFIETQEPGATRWKKISICTSELTFLGRKKLAGGLIPILADTDIHVCSIPSLVSLSTEGVKGLSCSIVMFIALYMEGMTSLDRNIHPWLLYTQENADIISGLLKKIRQRGMKGLDCYMFSPWQIMFQNIIQRKRIPDDIRELILSRAHLP